MSPLWWYENIYSSCMSFLSLIWPLSHLFYPFNFNFTFFLFLRFSFTLYRYPSFCHIFDPNDISWYSQFTTLWKSYISSHQRHLRYHLSHVHPGNQSYHGHHSHQSHQGRHINHTVFKDIKGFKGYVQKDLAGVASFINW
jgi:hypothetical protein